MPQGGLEALAEYGRALGRNLKKEDISLRAHQLSLLRENCNIPGDRDRDWFLVENYYFASSWVNHITSDLPQEDWFSLKKMTERVAHGIYEERQKAGLPDDQLLQWAQARHFMSIWKLTGTDAVRAAFLLSGDL